jgi:opacity protein-like surface antigen
MLRIAAAGLALLSTVAPLRAGDFYVEAALGLNVLQPTAGYYQLAPDHPIPAYQNRQMPSFTNYDAGVAAAFRVGHDWHPVRADFEISYTNSAVAGTDFLSTNGTVDFWDTDPGASGHTSILALLGNVYLDLATGAGITPYVGVGGGAALVSGQYESSIGSYLDAQVWAPAAQVSAGVALAVNSSVSLIADYRFRGIFNAVTREEFSEPIPNDTCCGGGHLGAVAVGGEGDIYDHIVTLGLRASFK